MVGKGGLSEGGRERLWVQISPTNIFNKTNKLNKTVTVVGAIVEGSRKTVKSVGIRDIWASPCLKGLCNNSLWISIPPLTYKFQSLKQ